MVKQLSSNARTITAAKVRFVPATAAPPYVPPHPDSEDKCEAAQQKPALSGLLDRIDGLLVALEHEADRLDERLDCLGGSGPAQIDHGVTAGPASSNAVGRLHDEADYLAHLVALVTASNDRLEQLV
jgi:hypothetical protein